jgi:hypothetical protein
MEHGNWGAAPSPRRAPRHSLSRHSFFAGRRGAAGDGRTGANQKAASHLCTAICSEALGKSAADRWTWTMRSCKVWLAPESGTKLFSEALRQARFTLTDPCSPQSSAQGCHRQSVAAWRRVLQGREKRPEVPEPLPAGTALTVRPKSICSLPLDDW